jgi:hypothetical protein
MFSIIKISILQQAHADMSFNVHIYNEMLLIIENKVFTMDDKKLNDFGMISPRRAKGNCFGDEIAQ